MAPGCDAQVTSSSATDVASRISLITVFTVLSAICRAETVPLLANEALRSVVAVEMNATIKPDMSTSMARTMTRATPRRDWNWCAILILLLWEEKEQWGTR